jgi:hypothetical protein
MVTKIYNGIYCKLRHCLCYTQTLRCKEYFIS